MSDSWLAILLYSLRVRLKALVILANFSLVSAALPSFAADAHIDSIIMPKRLYEVSAKHDYQLELLNAAMAVTEKEYGPYSITENNVWVSDKRAFESLRSNKLINIFHAPLHAEHMKGLHVVPIPIDRGALSYRVLLVHKDNVSAFQSVQTLGELSQFTTGMFEKSSTIKQLQNLKFPVLSTRSEETMFSMLEHKRFYYLLRGIHEVDDDLERYKETLPSGAIEPHLAVYLYMPSVFYMPKEQTHLAKRIEEGLLKLNETGEFKQIFDRYFRKYVDKAELHNRRIIRLNSTLEGIVDFHTEPGLWFEPNENQNSQ